MSLRLGPPRGLIHSSAARARHVVCRRMLVCKCAVKRTSRYIARGDRSNVDLSIGDVATVRYVNKRPGRRSSAANGGFPHRSSTNLADARIIPPGTDNKCVRNFDIYLHSVSFLTSLPFPHSPVTHSAVTREQLFTHLRGILDPPAR